MEKLKSFFKKLFSKLFSKLRPQKECSIEENWDKSVFLANMSHEIRTPMNAILTMSELLSESENLTDKEMDYVNTIYGASKSLLNIVNDILDYSKFAAGKYDLINESYSVSEMVNNLRNIVYFRAEEKNLDLNLSIDPRIPDHLIGDEGRIRQILLNLLNNAVKYTDVGFVDLKIGYHPIDDSIVELVLIVSDSGIGIKPEDIDTLFTEFSRVEQKENRGKEGIGLGLTICKQLVDLMGGKLTVSSEYGKGSVFSATIPQKIDVDYNKVKDKTVLSNMYSYTESEMYTLPTVRVLAVDDNRVNLKILRELLKKFELQFETAMSGMEALELIRNKTAYDLVFMDYMMPNMDGRETTMQIRKLDGCSKKKLPIIALTADVLRGTKEDLLACGMNDYLEKPVKREDLDSIIYRYISIDKRVYK